MTDTVWKNADTFMADSRGGGVEFCRRGDGPDLQPVAGADRRGGGDELAAGLGAES